MADPPGRAATMIPGEGRSAGLAIARMLAMITYQSEESMEMRFARKPVQQAHVLIARHSHQNWVSALMSRTISIIRAMRWRGALMPTVTCISAAQWIYMM